MRTAIIRLAAIFGLVAGALVFATAASADNTNPNGATVIDIKNQCQPDPFTGGQFCVTEHVVLQNDGFPPNTNPGGNSSITVNGRECLTETNSTGAVVFQECTNNYHQHVLIQNGTEQEAHFSYTDTFTTPYGTFCLTYNFHEANGQVQYDNISFTC